MNKLNLRKKRMIHMPEHVSNFFILTRSFFLILFYIFLQPVNLQNSWTKAKGKKSKSYVILRKLFVGETKKDGREDAITKFLRTLKKPFLSLETFFSFDFWVRFPFVWGKFGSFQNAKLLPLSLLLRKTWLWKSYNAL